MDTMTGMTWSKRPSWGLLIAGVVQLVVGVIFIGVAFSVPIVRNTFVIIGVIELIIGVGLVLVGIKARSRAQEAQQLKATGLAGQASIVGMRQTGVTMNEQPQVELQLQVQIPGRQPYQITKKEYVPLMLLGALTSGRPLPVKADPANLQNVVIEWESALSAPMGGAAGQGVIVGKDVDATPELVAQGAAQGMLPSESEIEYKRQRLRQFGKDGSAAVQSVQNTGQMVGRYQLFIVDLIITMEGETKDVPASAAVIDPAYAANVVPGVRVPVKYDADNHDDMTILWEEAKPPAV